MSSLPTAGLLAGALCDNETAPAILGSKSCSKCHEIYSLLHHHIMQHHLADSEGRDTNILNNILLSILALLTTSNKLPEIPLASSAPSMEMPGTVTSKLQVPDSSSLMKTQTGSNSPLPPLRLLGTGSAVTSLTVPTIVNAGDPSHATVHPPVIMPKTDAATALKSLLADSQLPLKHVPQLSFPTLSSQGQLKDQTSSLPSSQAQPSSSDALSLVREGLGTVPISQDLLSQFGHDNFANLDVLMKLIKVGGQGMQNDSDGACSSRANNASENLSSSSLQIAKSLASTFPILLGGQSGLTPDLMNMSTLQVAKQAEVPTSEKSDLDVADILVNKMPIPSISKGETGNAILDLHNLYLKQLSLQQNLFQAGQARNSREDETGAQSEGKLDVSGIPLFSTGAQKDPLSQGLENIAQIVAAQKQLTSLLSLIGKTKMDKAMPSQSKPDLMETTLSNPLFAQAGRGNVTSLPSVCPIPLANLFSSSTLHGKGGVIQTSATSQGYTSMSFPAATTLSSLASLHMPSLLSSITSTPIPQLSLPLSNPAGVPVTLPRSSSSSSFNRLESVISPRASTTTKTSTNLPSLAEHLFRTTASRISTSDSPQLFNLASVVATAPVDANVQGSSKLDSTKDSLTIGKGPGVSLLKLDGTDILSEAGLQGSSVDKIQGLINAARLTPQSSAVGLKALQKQPSTEGGLGIKHGKTEKHDGLSGIQNVSPRESEKEKASSKKLYKCDTCNVTFSVLSTLQAHEQIHLGTHMQCNYCYQVFTNSEEFQEHISLHRGQENVHHCQYCNRLFTSRGDLQKHLAEHTQKRPYKCRHCSKSFRDPGSLQKHERIHTGERPFHCTHCERAFAEYSSLRKHLRVHTGEQPYKCPHCPKAFSISGNLQRHLYIHTGERPYRCTKCPKAFNNPSHLRRHVKNLHDGKKSGSSRSHSIVKQESSEAGSESMNVDDFE